MNPVDPQFVKSLMENIYGNDENMVDTQSCEDAEKAVEKHASTMNDFGIPKNVGNAWKAPKAPTPKSQKLEDHAEEEKSLTESVDPMDERVTNIEQGLVSILESLKSLVSNLNEEGPSNADLDKIESEDGNQHHEKTAVGAQGSAATDDDDVPVGKRGEGKTQKLGKLLKGAKKGHPKTNELRMKARGHKLTQKQGNPGNQKLPKAEIDSLSKDS
tara:strand:- start:362 stop:1006 length:645 start_codon:yes stop_codon:yes gene_type:complete